MKTTNNTSLKGKNILLGVCGSIAAYKAAEIVSRLKKAGSNVNVIMTESACKFISPICFETLSENPVCIDVFSKPYSDKVQHIYLAKQADLFIVAPASANTVAKFSNGIADNMLTNVYLANKASVLLAPAMNTNMWNAISTQQNINTLLSRGVNLIGPVDGNLACGTVGAGKMIDPEKIVEAAENLLSNKDFLGKKVLITAGATVEDIDPVRYLSNRSSGKMGYAIAKAAALRGAKVSLIAGNVNLEVPLNVDLYKIRSTDDLLQVMSKKAIENDIVIQAAAPADFRPIEKLNNKLKKENMRSFSIELQQNPDVAKTIGENKKPGQIFVGFAAETDNINNNAVKKMQSKNLDIIISNDVGQKGAGFETDTNIASIINRQGRIDLPIMSKFNLANVILDSIKQLLTEE